MLLVLVSAGHSRVTLGGAVTAGGVVSLTNTLVEQVLEQEPLPVFSVKMKEEPQVEPAVIVTICWLAGPAIEPLPLMDQE